MCKHERQKCSFCLNFLWSFNFVCLKSILFTTSEEWKSLELCLRWFAWSFARCKFSQPWTNRKKLSFTLKINQQTFFRCFHCKMLCICTSRKGHKNKRKLIYLFVSIYNPILFTILFNSLDVSLVHTMLDKVQRFVCCFRSIHPSIHPRSLFDFMRKSRRT